MVGAVVRYLLGAMVALLCCGLGTPVKAQEVLKTQPMSYWLGRRVGFKIVFDTPVPLDAVAMIRHQEKAPGRGDDTKPRYRTFTYTIEGNKATFFTNELGWETPKLDEGSLTWVVDAGMGADWRQCDTTDPLWSNFAKGLRGLATDREGWSSAKVFLTENTGKNAPTYTLNLDGSIGQPSPAQLAMWKLMELDKNSVLTEEEVKQVRGYLLEIANAARANPDYRRQNNCKAALDLPKNLKPLVLNDNLNKAAQLQAEYCARTKQTTHDNEDPQYATMGDRLKAFSYDKVAYEAAGAGQLQDYPTGWMKSETHYRPWWNLEGQVVTSVGFGIAKGDDGLWYFVAVIGD